LTAGDEAKVKVFALPVPPTPSQSETHPKLDKKFTTPVAITHSKAASGLQTLPGGKIVFSQSSLTSPNDVFVATNLKSFEAGILSGNAASAKPTIDQITNLSAVDLKGKNLSEGEEFWFKGALDKNVQGWALKPKGWKAGEKKKWPGVLLIHGGLFFYRCTQRMYPYCVLMILGPQGAWEDQWSNRWNPNGNDLYGFISLNYVRSTLLYSLCPARLLCDHD